MRLRSQTRKQNVAEKMDITSLPKEVLFNLLLQVQPHEISTVCRSKNPRVRAICSSDLFQKEYKKKYPRRLMFGKISKDYDYETATYIFRDEIGNVIEITVDHPHTNKIIYIEYIPYKQIYPSTYTTSEKDMVLTENILRRENPLVIILDNDILDFGRRRTYGVYTRTDEENFFNSHGAEIKEFLNRIEKPNWWSEEYNTFRNDFTGTREAKKDFYDEVVKALQDVKIDRKPIWAVFKPIDID